MPTSTTYAIFSSTMALPLHNRQHIGWVHRSYHRVLMLASQARAMTACPQMWMQLALATNKVVGRYNSLVLDYFDARDVWYEDGIESMARADADCAWKGCNLLEAVLGRFPMGYLTQLESELYRMENYMKYQQYEVSLSKAALKQFRMFSDVLKHFMTINADTVPSLLMSDVALVYRYVTKRPSTEAIPLDYSKTAESEQSLNDLEDLEFDVNGLEFENTHIGSGIGEVDDDDYVLVGK